MPSDELIRKDLHLSKEVLEILDDRASVEHRTLKNYMEKVLSDKATALKSKNAERVVNGKKRI